MGTKLPALDNTGLNMTPMIDIVFQLVTFFMLTLDMSQKELAVLDLPRANQGIEDKDPSTDPKAKPEDKRRFVINIDEGGNLWFKGHSWPLAVADPVAQDSALEALRQELRKLTRDPILRNTDGTSKAMVLVRADRKAKFKYVQWIMQVCSDQNVQIYKIHFGIEHKRTN
jgi:biopolymer transport protein ExbD